MGFKLNQMVVKSAFLNEILKIETYVKQPKGCIDSYLLDHVFKLKNVLYRLKQASSTRYERLTMFLLEK